MSQESKSESKDYVFIPNYLFILLNFKDKFRHGEYFGFSDSLFSKRVFLIDQQKLNEVKIKEINKPSFNLFYGDVRVIAIEFAGDNGKFYAIRLFNNELILRDDLTNVPSSIEGSINAIFDNLLDELGAVGATLYNNGEEIYVTPILPTKTKDEITVKGIKITKYGELGYRLYVWDLLNYVAEMVEFNRKSIEHNVKREIEKALEVLQ